MTNYFASLSIRTGLIAGLLLIATSTVGLFAEAPAASPVSLKPEAVVCLSFVKAMVSQDFLGMEPLIIPESKQFFAQSKAISAVANWKPRQIPQLTEASVIDTATVGNKSTIKINLGSGTSLVIKMERRGNDWKVVFTSDGMLRNTDANYYKPVVTGLDEMIATTKVLVADLEKVTDKASVVAALNKYADVTIVQQKNMAQIQAGYPELMSQNEPPEVLQDVLIRFNKMQQVLQGSIGKIADYMKDPDVVAILNRLNGQN